MELWDVFFRGLQNASPPLVGADSALSVSPTSRRARAWDSEADPPSGSQDVEAATLRKLLAKYGETPAATTPIATLTWSEFQRAYADARLSQRDLVELFQRQRKAWSPIAPYPPPAPRPPSVQAESKRTEHTNKASETSKRQIDGFRRDSSSSHGAGPIPSTTSVHATPPFPRFTIPQHRLPAPATGALRPESDLSDIAAALVMERAFEEAEGVVQDISRVTDSDGSDVSFEEQFARYKSRVRTTVAERPSNGGVVLGMWFPRGGLKELFCSSERFLTDISFEEDRAAFNQSLKANAFTITSRPAVRPTKQLAKDKIFAHYPPSTESLPKLTTTVSSLNFSLLLSRRTQRARSLIPHPARSVHQSSITPLSRTLTDCASKPDRIAPLLDLSQLSLSDRAQPSIHAPDEHTIDQTEMPTAVDNDQTSELPIGDIGESLGDAIDAGEKVSRSLGQISGQAWKLTSMFDPSAPRDPPPLDSSIEQGCAIKSKIADGEEAANSSDTQDAASDSSAEKTIENATSSHKVYPSAMMITIPTQSPEERNPNEYVRGLVADREEVAVSLMDAPSNGVRALIEARVEILAKATLHESVTRVFGFVSIDQDNKIGLVFELHDEFESISSIMHHGKLNVVDKLQLLIQIVEAVESIHAYGVAHGDLTLQNVDMTRNYTKVKLTRVGHTRLQSLVSATTHSSVIGSFPECFLVGCTPAYAAPEVLRGEISQCDEAGWRRSDIYALGVIAAEILLGRSPWEGETPMFVWNSVAHKAKRPFFLGELRFQGKPCRVLETLISCAWHQNPELRLSARDLAQGLRALLATSLG